MGGLASCATVSPAVPDAASAAPEPDAEAIIYRQRGDSSASEYDGSSAAGADADDVEPVVVTDPPIPIDGPPPDPDELRLADLQKPHRVFRGGIRPNPGVAVRLGPVIGRVTATTAVILLEAEVACDITVNIARIRTPGETQASDGEYAADVPATRSVPHASWGAEIPLTAYDLHTMSFESEGALSLNLRMLPRRPYTFLARGLRPATGHIVMLSGVCQDDIYDRIGLFRTMPCVVNTMRVLAFAGHSSPRRPLGATNPWHRIFSVAKGAPETTLSLHVGTSIDVKTAVAAAAKELVNFHSFKEGIRKDMEKRARYALRGAYCAAWGRQEGLRRVLASVGSHICTFAPPFDPGPLRNQLALAGVASSLGPEMQLSKDEVEVLSRLALEVYVEYERNLWHASVERSKAHATNAADEDDRDAGFACECAATSRSSSEDDDWHFHRYGTILVLSFDVQGQWSHVGAGMEHSSWSGGFAAPMAGSPQASRKRTMLSSSQWIALARALSEDGVEVIVVLSSAPFVLQEPSKQRVDDAAGSIISRSWLSHVDELDRLLKMLFDWKHARYPSAEIVMISGGLGYGATGDIRDCELGLSITVMATGPVLGPISTPPEDMLWKGTIGSRFSFAHRPPVLQWNACVVDIDVGSHPGKPAVDVQMVCMPEHP